LAAAIERVVADPGLRARLGQAGRRAYEAEFTEAVVVARYRCFFDRLAPRCAASPA
jgi:glycosyltransferase involved in cell wall biosynthesis